MSFIILSDGKAVFLLYVCVCLFVDENDAEKGDNLIFSLHPIPVRTVTN